jgi:energy-coupling factor transporter ATP-binding protein EcfA2
VIERIVVENFKSLKKVDLKLGALNLFIGTNASGKSNFFDALRVLQGIGNGFTISEVLDGKPKSATSEVWEAIRGGSAKATFAGPGAHSDEVAFTVWGRLPGSSGGARKRWQYSVAFAAELARVTREKLSIGGDIYDSEPLGPRTASDPVLKVRYYKGGAGNPPHLAFEPNRPVLLQLSRRNGDGGIKRAHAEAAAEVARALSNMQRLDPSPQVLRGYSQAHQIGRMGEHGENFAALIRAIAKDEAAKDAYLAWLKQLRPAEVTDVGTLTGAVGEPMFMLREGDREYPAPVLSDGTLRFAAITAVFFQTDMPAVLTIEEIENGIHAHRVRLLVELLRSQAARGGTQVMATTHSPIVLAWLKPAEYATTFFCRRDEVSGESHIQPLPEIPHFNEVVARQPIADLFSEGWLEGAL